MNKTLADEIFKFKIGQIVAFKASISAANAWNLREEESRFPNKIMGPMLLINERIIQECPGGFQLLYRGRVHTPDKNSVGVSTRNIEMNEIELVEVNDD